MTKEMTIEERMKEENQVEKRSMKRETSGGNFTLEEGHILETGSNNVRKYMVRRM